MRTHRHLNILKGLSTLGEPAGTFKHLGINWLLFRTSFKKFRQLDRPPRGPGGGLRRDETDGLDSGARTHGLVSGCVKGVNLMCACVGVICGVSSLVRIHPDVTGDTHVMGVRSP